MTIVEICNMALGYLATEAIVTLADGTVRATLLSQNYATVRDAILEERDWQFASVWSKAPSAGTPVHPDYDYELAKPAGCVAVREVCDADHSPIEWKLEGAYILVESLVEDLVSAGTDGAYLRVTQQITDPTLWPSNFVLAYAHRLASVLAVPLTENRQLQADQWNLYRQTMDEAASVDSMQGRPFQGPYISSLAAARST